MMPILQVLDFLDSLRVFVLQSMKVSFYFRLSKVACHGIPNLRPLEKGDSLNIDVSIYLDGVHGDSSLMVTIGEVHPDIKKLIKAT